MVEINVRDADAALVDALVLRLHRLFDRSAVSYDAVRRQLRVGSAEEGSAVAIVQAVESWLDERRRIRAAPDRRSFLCTGGGRPWDSGDRCRLSRLRARSDLRTRALGGRSRKQHHATRAHLRGPRAGRSGSSVLGSSAMSPATTRLTRSPPTVGRSSWRTLPHRLRYRRSWARPRTPAPSYSATVSNRPRHPHSRRDPGGRRRPMPQLSSRRLWRGSFRSRRLRQGSAGDTRHDHLGPARARDRSRRSHEGREAQERLHRPRVTRAPRTDHRPLRNRGNAPPAWRRAQRRSEARPVGGPLRAGTAPFQRLLEQLLDLSRLEATSAPITPPLWLFAKRRRDRARRCCPSAPTKSSCTSTPDW